MQKKTGSFQEKFSKNAYYRFLRGAHSNWFRFTTLLSEKIINEHLRGLADGCFFIPTNSSLLASSKKENILGEVKKYDRRSSLAGKRRIMAQSKGTDVMIQLINEAIKSGHRAKYVLFDRCFFTPHQDVELKNKGLDIIAMVKVSSGINYEFNGERKNIKQIYNSR